MELVFVLLVLIAVVCGIIKDYNPQAVLALAGMALFTVAYWLGLHPILPADKSTGFALFDLFEVFKGSSPTGRRGSASPSWRWRALPPTCPHIGASQAWCGWRSNRWRASSPAT